MIDRKQFVRKAIFGVFCCLILTVSLSLNYLVSFYPEKQATAVESKQLQEDECENKQNIMFYGKFFFKILAAFFAGGILSDTRFVKLGVF